MTSVQKEFDAIVVGTGPGGGTTAKELTASGKKVLMLEWGNNNPIKGTAAQAMSQMMVPGKSFLITNGMLGIARGITTGGSSIFYYGTAFEPPVDLFKSYGVDITQEVEEVRKELPIGKLSDNLFGPMAKRMMESAKDLGYQWEKLPKFNFQDRCKADCWKCNWGCPESAKWNARMSVDEAVNNGAVLINHARATSVIKENGKAVGVNYQKKGKNLSARAPLVILSAGGIGSPMILRQSGISQAGYDFFYDPLIAVMGTVKDMTGGKEIPMASGIHMEDEGYLMTDMTFPWTLHTIFSSQVLRFHKMFSHSNTLQIMIKIKDELGGQLTDNGSVRKGLTKSDKEKFAKGFKRAKGILENAGAKDVFKSWYVAAHPGGTCKINDIVDTHLMTEIENLYVCDCSVVPEAWGLPPTFTLVCLAKRLAKHLT